MLKKILVSVVILLSVTSSAFAADVKIGVFNERLVISKIPQAELIEARLKKQFSDRIAELTKIREKGIAIQEKGQRDSMTMTEAQKLKLQRELTDIGSQLQAKDKNLKEDYQRANQQEIQAIRMKVQQTVKELAENEGFDLILRVESVAYTKNALDVSNKIITILSTPAG